MACVAKLYTEVSMVNGSAPSELNVVQDVMMDLKLPSLARSVDLTVIHSGHTHLYDFMVDLICLRLFYDRSSNYLDQCSMFDGLPG